MSDMIKEAEQYFEENDLRPDDYDKETTITVALRDKMESDLVLCGKSCIYLDEDNGVCNLFEKELEEDDEVKGYFLRNQLCYNIIEP